MVNSNRFLKLDAHTILYYNSKPVNPYSDRMKLVQKKYKTKLEKITMHNKDKTKRVQNMHIKNI